MLVLGILIPFTGLVLDNVKNLDVWGKDAFHIAIFLLMVSPLMVRGTSKNLFTCNGNNGIAKVIVVIIVCWIERKKEKHLVMVLSSTMVNGPSSVYMEFRSLFLLLSLPLTLQCISMVGYPFSFFFTTSCL